MNVPFANWRLQAATLLVVLPVLGLAAASGQQVIAVTPAAAALPAGVTLVPIDGGPNYFASLSPSSAWMDQHILLGGWLEQPLSATQVGYGKSMGDNIYWNLAGRPSDTSCGGPCRVDYDVIRAGGMHAAAPGVTANSGSETVAYDGTDESDMNFGPGWNGYHNPNDDVWNGNACVPANAGCGFTANRLFYNGDRTGVSAATANPDYPTSTHLPVHQGLGKGVLFWESQADASPGVTLHDVVANVTAFNNEVNALNGVLLSPTANGYVSATGDVTTMAKDDNGAFYVLAGSGQLGTPPPANQSVQFTLAGGYTGPVTVFNENRTLQAVNGVFTDTFADANAIRVYQIGTGTTSAPTPPATAAPTPTATGAPTPTETAVPAPAPAPAPTASPGPTPTASPGPAPTLTADLVTLKSGIFGKCLGDHRNGAANHNKVEIYGRNGTAAQKWAIVGETIRINGKCLSIFRGGKKNGTRVDLSRCNGAGAQDCVRNGARLVNPRSGKCLDVPGLPHVNGRQLEIMTCLGTAANQRWTVSPVT